MIRAGKLRHRMTVRAPTFTQDTQGGIVESWSDAGNVWGSIETLNGRELAWAGQSHSQATVQIVIRYFAGLTERHRLKFGTRIFGIESMNNEDERNVRMTLMCRELR